MATAKPKPLHIFRAGKHIDAKGNAVEITEADVLAAAQAYDVALHEAPIVIGHPVHDAPAFGWVRGLSAKGADLEAEPDQVNPEFGEMVGKGLFKKISASFYRPDSPSNPKPGVWYLRHVGFLGAQPPAVKGLKAVAFSDEDDAVTIEFGERVERGMIAMLRRLRDWMISTDGLESADKILPDYDLNYLQEAAALPENSEASPAFSETEKQEDHMMSQEDIAAKQAELDKQAADLASKDAAFAEREQNISKAEAGVRATGCTDFVETLAKEGKVLPAHKAGLAEFMASLDHKDAVEFSEGDGKVSKTPLEFIKGYLAAQPKVIEFAELAAAAKDMPASTVGMDIPPGYTVDQGQMELHNKAVAFSEANNVDYITAVNSVTREQ